MAISQSFQIRQQVYIHLETTNQSFLDMHYFLKAKGIKNNAFFLSLYDTDLIGVDPYDPHLSTVMKQKILRECIVNYWYFLREVARLRGSMYKALASLAARGLNFIAAT